MMFRKLRESFVDFGLDQQVNNLIVYATQRGWWLIENHDTDFRNSFGHRRVRDVLFEWREELVTNYRVSLMLARTPFSWYDYTTNTTQRWLSEVSVYRMQLADHPPYEWADNRNTAWFGGAHWENRPAMRAYKLRPDYAFATREEGISYTMHVIDTLDTSTKFDKDQHQNLLPRDAGSPPYLRAM